MLVPYLNGPTDPGGHESLEYQMSWDRNADRAHRRMLPIRAATDPDKLDRRICLIAWPIQQALHRLGLCPRNFRELILRSRFRASLTSTGYRRPRCKSCKPSTNDTSTQRAVESPTRLTVQLTDYPPRSLDSNWRWRSIIWARPHPCGSHIGTGNVGAIEQHRRDRLSECG